MIANEEYRLAIEFDYPENDLDVLISRANKDKDEVEEWKRRVKTVKRERFMKGKYRKRKYCMICAWYLEVYLVLKQQKYWF